MSSLAQQWSTIANLAEVFAARAAEQPEAPAVTLGACTVSFAELNRMSNAIGAALQVRGVRRGDRVALVCDRSVELIAAMLGVWRAGAAFIPVDSRYPEARISETLEDAAPCVVLADSELRDARWCIGHSMLWLKDVCLGKAEMHPVEMAMPEDLAYVIYTSGSTGKPKGVMVTQRNVSRLLTETEAWFGFSTYDVWTMFHSPAFDFSVWEIWGSLLTGGRLVIVPHELCRDPEAVCALIAQHQVTVLNQTPSAFQLLMQAEARSPKSMHSLRYVIFGGEALQLSSLLPWMGRHGDQKPELVNMYGITETTVHVTRRRILREDAEQETASLIGEPIGDLQVHVLDEAMRPVVEGEMYVGGEGVAAGYLNMPELTAERFLPNPFGNGRLYKTGDLARRREDGELVYLGRGDSQVKLHGYRIELGEIEAVLLAKRGVRQVCVTLQRNASGKETLAAFIVSEDGTFDVTSLTGHVAGHLPAHMRPTHFVLLERLPLTINGKVDRTALPLATYAVSNDAEIAATGTEELVSQTWKHVLGIGAIDPTLNFFEAGGTSLLLHRLKVELERVFALPIGILPLFQYSTVRTFAAWVDAKRTEAKEEPAKAVVRHVFRASRKVMQV